MQMFSNPDRDLKLYGRGQRLANGNFLDRTGFCDTQLHNFLGQHYAKEEATAKRAQAAMNLDRTVVRARADGIVSQTNRLQVGNITPSGVPALSLVVSDNVWVEANFKETDLNHMRVGQPAEMEFDAYPDLKVRGRVQSIGAGTGSEFSVLPAQNANGNWVKVTQRVPVRIAIDGTPPRAMIAGLSTDVKIDTGAK